MPALRCVPKDWSYLDSACGGAEEWKLHHNTTFLAACRERTLPWYETQCPNTTSLSYRWKSYAQSPDRDDDDYARLRSKAAEKHLRVVAFYSVGAHHFSRYPDYHGKQYAVPDDWVPPQAWMDEWFAEMSQLMQRLSMLRSHGVCVLWKTNNIGYRLQGSVHHPSAAGAWHDHLNTFAAAISAKHAIPVVDYRSITEAATRNATQKQGLPRGRADWDYYHGYPFDEIWRQAALDVTRLCGLQDAG